MSGELAVIGRGLILAQFGPMRLTIEAWDQGGPSESLAAEAGKYAFTLLPRLVPARELFRLDRRPFRDDHEEPLLNQMVLAARATGLDDLGPMAAVAGAAAGAVALYLKEAGAVKAIVENGGDLALYLGPGQTARVGVRLGLSSPEPDYRLMLSGDARPFWGVASSGLGGRGLTQGLADTALCLADSPAVADAAATAVGNHCWVDSPAVKMVPAASIDQGSDIGGLWVTASAGDLSDAEIDEALARALAYATGLTEAGAIDGAVISLRGRVVKTPDFDRLAAPMEKIKG